MASGQSNQPRAEAQCPWFTSGTAANVLGGEVTAAISGSGPTEGSCRFALRDASTDFIQIHVSAEPLRGCQVGSTPLHGIGNEAQRCVVSREHGMTQEMASGRVRTVYFTVTMSVRGNRKSAKPSGYGDDSLTHIADDPLDRVADEVSGNLY